MNGHKPSLLLRHFFCPPHCRSKIRILTDDDGNVVFLLVSIRYQVNGQADVSAFLPPVAAHRAAGNDNPLVTQTSELAVPELMPSPRIWNARVGANLRQNTARDQGHRRGRQFGDIIAGLVIRRRLNTTAGSPSHAGEVIKVLTVNEDYGAHDKKPARGME